MCHLKLQVKNLSNLEIVTIGNKWQKPATVKTPGLTLVWREWKKKMLHWIGWGTWSTLRCALTHTETCTVKQGSSVKAQNDRQTWCSVRREAAVICFYPLQYVALGALCCNLPYMNCKCHQLTYFRLYCKMKVKLCHHFCGLKWLPTMLKEL